MKIYKGEYISDASVGEYPTKVVVEAKVGWTIFNGQAAHFSVTASVKEYKRFSNEGDYNCKIFESGGQCHEYIAKAIPEIIPLIKWHLVAWPGLPMHYIANALYWLEYHYGLNKYPREYGHNPMDAFKSTVVFGACSTDNESNIPHPLARGDNDAKKISLRREVEIWCENRLEELVENFHKDLKAFDIDINPAIEHHARLAKKL